LSTALQGNACGTILNLSEFVF